MISNGRQQRPQVLTRAPVTQPGISFQRQQRPQVLTRAPVTQPGISFQRQQRPQVLTRAPVTQPGISNGDQQGPGVPPNLPGTRNQTVMSNRSGVTHHIPMTFSRQIELTKQMSVISKDMKDKSLNDARQRLQAAATKWNLQLDGITPPDGMFTIYK